MSALAETDRRRSDVRTPSLLPGELHAARIESRRVFALYLKGNATPDELVAALRAEYRLEGWIR